MRFEWDARKERINQAKHGGIDFDFASRVFDDPLCVCVLDRTIEGEQRWHAIGSVRRGPADPRQIVLLVVHTYKENIYGEETIRIISARRASKQDVRRYQKQAVD